MKFDKIILAAAALIIVACVQENTKGRTCVTCSFGSESPDSVTFTIGENWDTTVAVVRGKVKAYLPVDRTQLAFMLINADPVHFVSDGSHITIDTETGLAESDDPDGVTSRIKALNEWDMAFMEEFNAKIETMDEADQEAYVDQAVEEYNGHYFEVLSQNTDNVVGLLAISSIQTDDDAKMMEALSSLSDELRQDPYVQKLLSLYETKAKTAPGTHFIDFTVVQDPEKPKKSTVKFSDYVGKGKFVLVDFWASWCGPCKAEIPTIAKVYKKYKGKNFNVLSIAVWDEPSATKESAKEVGIKWDQIINAQKIPTEIYGIEGIPHIMLIGPDGTIIARGLRGEDIEKAVSEALASAKKK
ncbi:MAG: TlpA family protein disulfide reductase [Bacteroidales bacterium]|nr:TlpA family protein disulfide reductase [Bacteroidales bacterium]